MYFFHVTFLEHKASKMFMPIFMTVIMASVYQLLLLEYRKWLKVNIMWKNGALFLTIYLILIFAHWEVFHLLISNIFIH